jgi:CBS domain containing-hemolysin-like protein
MIWVVFAAGVVLAALLVLTTLVQMLYLESLRLRTRDLPALQFFKAEIEARLGFETEEGALRFSLVKHTALPLLGMIVLGGGVLSASFSAPVIGEAVVFGWLTMMVSSYLIPQILYRRTEGKWLVPLLPVCRFVGALAAPVAGMLNFLHSLLEITNAPSDSEEPATPAENIDALITAGTEEGLIEEEDRKLIQSVVEFGDTVVREVMTPRPNIVAVEADSTLEELRQVVIDEQFSRIPVYEGSIDSVIGFVHVRDMFELEEDERARQTVRQLMRPIRFVPETKPVNDLMREMQAEGAHMVIVVDEYGNTAGLATMEDLVEVILGEIRDEHEPDSDVVEDGHGGYIVSGNFDLTRVTDLFGLGPEEHVDSTTIGGMVTEWLGRVPSPGEIVERDELRVEVLASDEMHVERVRLSKAIPAQTPEAGASSDKKNNNSDKQI